MQWIEFLGRILLAQLFFLAGLGKISGYAATQGYMESMGVSGSLLPLVIALEIVAPLMLIVGWRTRLAAAALAGFTVIAAAIFHHDLANQMQMIMFTKDLAITGGLMLLCIYGPGRVSLDHRVDQARKASL
ncbi:MAG TPA: DoxX family protein [Mariprofundaceae bacterium]|nr:DoxX family protein [Mariprofundaceae bacterium]